MTQPVSRRNFLKLMGATAASAALAACAPQATATTAARPRRLRPPLPPVSIKNKKYTNTKVTFWTQAYGDSAVWQKDYLEAMGAKFKDESGVDTEFQIVPWANANQVWLTVAQGGAAPDGGRYVLAVFQCGHRRRQVRPAADGPV